MSLSPQQVSAVQSSFALVAAQADAVAARLYARLFAAQPELRQMFPADMTAQREKLVATLAFVVRGLGDMRGIEQTVRDLGARHRAHKVAPKHYDMVGAALLDTLADMLGPRWTPELRQAWASTYAALASTMQRAAA